MVAASTWARRLGISLLVVLLALLAQQALHPTPSAAAPVVVTPPGLKVAEVTAGESHTCLLKTDGTVACWGGYGAEVSPLPAGPYTAISAAGSRTCGLKQDQSIVCWGVDFGPVRIPGAYASVSAGADDFGCALEIDQGVTCWSLLDDEVTLSHVDGPMVAVDAGWGHACGIKPDESVVCWGANDSGQAPSEISGSFRSISAGVASTCGVEVDGGLRCWGDNSNGRAPATTSGRFSMVSTVLERTCAVRNDGAAVCWGQPLSGDASPEEVAGQFRSLSAGSLHVCGVDQDDRLSCWGDMWMMPTPPGTIEPDDRVLATAQIPYRHDFAVESSSEVKGTVEGALPAGIRLTTSSTDVGVIGANLVLSGTPTKPGTYVFTLVATNLFGSSQLRVSLRVMPQPGYDVNGDGIPDLPVGAPGENVGSKVDAGQVTALLGAADGSYGRKGAVAITQETLGHHSERGDRFGAAITTGEVTGDNYVDLIIGVPGEDKGAGQVIVVSGSAKGLAGARKTALKQGAAGAAGAAEAGDGFGSAVSIGEGLWVGAPGEDLGRAGDAGVVTRFPVPLKTVGSVQYQQGSRKVPGSAEKGDRFGTSLAGGGTLIGAPGEDVGSIVDAGAVTWQQRYVLTQDSAGIPGSAERGDQFGAAVAMSGTLWGEEETGGLVWYQLIGIGAPGEDVGANKDAGMITFASDDVFDEFDDEDDAPVAITQSTWSPRASAESGDRFGATIAITADGRKLIVGAPLEDVNSTRDAGAVSVLSVSLGCDEDNCEGRVANGSTLDQNSSGVPGVVRAGSQFGATLAERPGTAGGYVVGAPGETVSGKAGAGAVVVMPTKGTAQELHQDSPGIPGGAEKGDRFGTVPTP